MSIDLTINQPISANSNYVMDQDGNASPLSLSLANVGVGTLGGSGKLAIQGDTNNSGSSALTIRNLNNEQIFQVDDDGAVYIRNSGSSKLEVNGLINIGGQLTLSANSEFETDTYGLYETVNNQPIATISEAVPLYRFGNNILNIDYSNENVGIGTGDVSPSEKLEVSGSVKASGQLTVNGNASLTSDVFMPSLPDAATAPLGENLEVVVVGTDGKLYKQ